jgi:parvulin-like peptidyl-prolyl isomerase
MTTAKSFIAILFGIATTIAIAADPDPIVVSDGGVSITRSEMAAALQSVPESLKNAAKTDPAERVMIIDTLLRTRKMAAKYDALPEDTPGYWRSQFKIQALKKNFVAQLEQGEMKIQNPEPLMEEYYKTKKERYARIPEKRASSHILLASPPGLPRDEVRAEAQKLLDELRAGADFEEYVKEYSDDPGSKARDGRLSKSVSRGELDITPPYLEALFEIEEVGGYSEITDSQFGVHIIRLDGITPGGYKDYEDVKQEIFNDIVAEYTALVAQEVSARYMITEDAFIDGAALDELLSEDLSAAKD